MKRPCFSAQPCFALSIILAFLCPVVASAAPSPSVTSAPAATPVRSLLLPESEIAQVPLRDLSKRVRSQLQDLLKDKTPPEQDALRSALLDALYARISAIPVARETWTTNYVDHAKIPGGLPIDGDEDADIRRSRRDDDQPFPYKLTHYESYLTIYVLSVSLYRHSDSAELANGPFGLTSAMARNQASPSLGRWDVIFYTFANEFLSEIEPRYRPTFEAISAFSKSPNPMSRFTAMKLAHQGRLNSTSELAIKNSPDPKDQKRLSDFYRTFFSETDPAFTEGLGSLLSYSRKGPDAAALLQEFIEFKSRRNELTAVQARYWRESFESFSDPGKPGPSIEVNPGNPPKLAPDPFAASPR